MHSTERNRPAATSIVAGMQHSIATHRILYRKDRWFGKHGRNDGGISFVAGTECLIRGLSGPTINRPGCLFILILPGMAG